MKKSIPLTALLGAAPVAALFGAGTMITATDASAEALEAKLDSVFSFAAQGASTWNLSLDTSTWTFDSATGIAQQTGGTYIGEVLAPNVFGHTMTGVKLGNFAPSLGTWSCQEGTFGTSVGASLCGNYNFGSNKKNQSTYAPSAQGAVVTVGGDDVALGSPQSLQSSYSNMTATKTGDLTYILSNKAAGTCTAPFCSGYDFTFTVVPAPPAVWLLGTALAGLAARRLRKQTKA